MLGLVLAVLSVLVASALCSGAEAALFSVSLVKAQALAAEGSAKGRALLEIRAAMERPIAAIVILNNIANIVGSIIVGSLAAGILGETWLGVFSGVLTFMVIVFSEIIPKTIGERNADALAPAIARTVLTVTKLLTPLIWFIELVTRPIVGESKAGLTVNEAQIRMLAGIAAKQGSIGTNESELIRRAFTLDDRRAREIMTPRVSMSSLRGDATLEDCRAAIVSSQHTRLVVVGNSRDDVIGVVLRSELLVELLEGRGGARLRDIAEEVPTTTEDVRADALLREFQTSRRHLAVVLDEFGGVAGVVTLEDVLEILTGEIVDETDQVVDLRAGVNSPQPRG
ncbi:Magnesium and cobalt efflux protein CorC [Enhygromyxa salina]|uniref:Magnesium and cobalt efflux protein CorC n=1 Tax=Enhygromyxa salina TaxID=215803 RepID=A0A0C2A0I1_9BACT|nr:hemolysin family protein [Enhygromyxa salina]KIG16888.1 Magnesium and cobalt efflux protein CorC [Enhygromyxa salina]